MSEMPQHWQNLIALAAVLMAVIAVGLVAWCLCAIGDRTNEEPVEVINEDLDLLPKKRPRQHYVDGG